MLVKNACGANTISAAIAKWYAANAIRPTRTVDAKRTAGPVDALSLTSRAVDTAATLAQRRCPNSDQSGDKRRYQLRSGAARAPARRAPACAAGGPPARARARRH